MFSLPNKQNHISGENDRRHNAKQAPAAINDRRHLPKTKIYGQNLLSATAFPSLWIYVELKFQKTDRWKLSKGQKTRIHFCATPNGAIRAKPHNQTSSMRKVFCPFEMFVKFICRKSLLSGLSNFGLWIVVDNLSGCTLCGLCASKWPLKWRGFVRQLANLGKLVGRATQNQD